MAAIALVLATVETALPSPLPGVKPGLGNIITLVALERLGWKGAAWVSLLRVLGAALLVGSLFTPGFFLSLAGAATSLAGLALMRPLPATWVGPVGQSVVAAFFHLAGQLVVARLWLVPSDGLYYFVPLLAISALLTGIVNGLVAVKLMDRLQWLPPPPSPSP